jgi:hypothetical protein
MKAVNSIIVGPFGKVSDRNGAIPVFHLAGPKGTPRVLLKCSHLIALMKMEVAMIVAHGARIGECEHCGDMFATGPMTGRRSHARFCSDRCRVAAMRARNKREDSTPPPS